MPTVCIRFAYGLPRHRRRCASPTPLNSGFDRFGRIVFGLLVLAFALLLIAELLGAELGLAAGIWRFIRSVP